MIGGDISNEAPKRLYIALDCVGKVTTHEERKFLRKHITTDVEWDLRELNHVWNLRERYSVITTLVVYGKENGQQYIDELEERGINPFNYVETYYDRDAFIADLPYFFNVVGIVDTPDNVARYGSFGIELSTL